MKATQICLSLLNQANTRSRVNCLRFIVAETKNINNMCLKSKYFLFGEVRFLNGFTLKESWLLVKLPPFAKEKCG